MAITKSYQAVDEVTLDLFSSYTPSPVVECPQFEDRGRAIKATLKIKGEKYSVPAGHVPHVYVLKFDGKVVDNLCEYEDDKVMVELTRQMTFVEGDNIAKVAIVNSTTGAVVQSATILLKVLRGANVDEAEQSTDEFKALDQYAAEAKASADKAAQSEANAESSKTAAQAAMQETLDAEGRVQAIVAGNEAYTKQQANDRFALALKGSADAAQSITIYPDEGSNVVVTAHGFTKQEGSGDASPVNVRPIVNGGSCVNLLPNNVETKTVNGVTVTKNSDGTVAAKGQASANAFFTLLSSSENLILPKGTYWASTHQDKLLGNVGYLRVQASATSSYVFNKPVSFESDGATPFNASFAFVPQGQSFDFVIYPSVTISKDVPYTPYSNEEFGTAVSIGSSAVATLLGLTAPLCEGDTIITKIKSGCDKVVTFDGSEDEGWKLNSSDETDAAGSKRFSITVSVPAANTSYTAKPSGLCNRLTGNTPNNTNTGWSGANTYSEINSLIHLRLAGVSTEESLRAALKENPVTVWYRSTNYTDAADITVSLETHVQWFEVLSQGDAWVQSNPSYGAPGTNQFYRKTNYAAKQGGKTTCSCYKGILGNATSSERTAGTISVSTSGNVNVYVDSAESLESFKSALAEIPQAAIVYELATPLVYAHDPVDFIANPDEDGAWVITGEADGKVSATYNKSLTHTIAEMQAALLTVAAKLSL